MWQQGQRVRITLSTGAEHEGIYVGGHPDNPSFSLKMVQPRKQTGDVNGAGKRDSSSTMSFQRKDIVDGRPAGANTNKGADKAQNGMPSCTLASALHFLVPLWHRLTTHSLRRPFQLPDRCCHLQFPSQRSASTPALGWRYAR